MFNPDPTLKAIEQHMLKPPVEGVRRTDQFNPSSASAFITNKYGEKELIGPCHRLEWYRTNKVKPDEEAVASPQALRKMESGNIFSEWWVEYVKQLGLWLGDEVAVYDAQTNMSFRVDCITRHPENHNVPIGWEIKSIGGYYQIKTLIQDPHAIPKWDHILQTLCYMWYYRRSIKFWKILYIERDQLQWRAHDLRLVGDGDDTYQILCNGVELKITFDDIMLRFRALGEIRKQAEPPPREYMLQYPVETIKILYERGEMGKTAMALGKKKKWDKIVKGDWRCKYCENAIKCWTPEIGEKATRKYLGL